MHLEEHQPRCKLERVLADQPGEACQQDWEGLLQALEDRHRLVGLEGFLRLASQVERRQVLEGEDHREERHQDSNHLQVSAGHLEDLPLAFSRLPGFKGRLVKVEDFHHRVLEGDEKKISIQRWQVGRA